MPVRYRETRSAGTWDQNSHVGDAVSGPLDKELRLTVTVGTRLGYLANCVCGIASDFWGEVRRTGRG